MFERKGGAMGRISDWQIDTMVLRSRYGSEDSNIDSGNGIEAPSIRGPFSILLIEAILVPWPDLRAGRWVWALRLGVTALALEVRPSVFRTCLWRYYRELRGQR
jgi:hypothetical protein